MTFVVRFTAAAREDLRRLHDHLLDRATTAEDLDLADEALATIRQAMDLLRRTPFICRKAGSDAFLRELLIPFGRSGYVALFEIEDGGTVTILAVRHQLEDDYH